MAVLRSSCKQIFSLPSAHVSPSLIICRVNNSGLGTRNYAQSAAWNPDRVYSDWKQDWWLAEWNGPSRAPYRSVAPFTDATAEVYSSACTEGITKDRWATMSISSPSPPILTAKEALYSNIVPTSKHTYIWLILLCGYVGHWRSSLLVTVLRRRRRVFQCKTTREWLSL